MESYLNSMLESLLGYGPNVIAAFVIFAAGWTAAKILRKILRRALARANFDETLSVFLSRLAYILLLVFVVIGVSYHADLRKATQVLESILSEESRVLKDPESVVAVPQLGESSVAVVVRPWVRTDDYWPVAFDLNERIKVRLDEEGIPRPFPQRDVHLHHVGENKPAS